MLKTEKGLDRIISKLLQKQQEQVDFKSAQQEKIHSSPDPDKIYIEREAEKFLSRADQKYKDYFEYSKLKDCERQDCIFKDMYNLNHHIIKLLQSAEDKIESELTKTTKTRKLLDDLEKIFTSEKRDETQILKQIKGKLMSESDELIQENVKLKNELTRRGKVKEGVENLSYYKEQISLLEKKNEILNEKLRKIEKDMNNNHRLDTQSETTDNYMEKMQNLGNLQQTTVMQERFEETNAALERAFDRISILESENNKLLGSVNTEKQEKLKMEKEFQTKLGEYNRMKEQKQSLDIEKSNIRETLRSNGEMIEQLKADKSEAEMKLRQLTEEKKIFGKFSP